MFKHRATKPERIDTGDYTPEEYQRFLKEIRFINQRLGDRAALEGNLLSEIERLDLKEFSVLDVGAGTGELLGTIADAARSQNRRARLIGLDLNDLSIKEIADESERHNEISPVQANALAIPFSDGSFDYAICSLFTHHLTDRQVVAVIAEMARVARRGILVIDLERSPAAWFLYQLFCFAFRISPLVRQDGSLSVRKGFRVAEFEKISRDAGLTGARVTRAKPYRVVLSTIST